jgi:hypothetical protein
MDGRMKLTLKNSEAARKSGKEGESGRKKGKSIWGRCLTI